jgi:hypothetical protein
VRAIIADCIVVAIEIKQRNAFAVHLDVFRRAGGKLIGARDFDKLCHRLSPSKVNDYSFSSLAAKIKSLFSIMRCLKICSEMQRKASVFSGIILQNKKACRMRTGFS